MTSWQSSKTKGTISYCARFVIHKEIKGNEATDKAAQKSLSRARNGHNHTTLLRKNYKQGKLKKFLKEVELFDDIKQYMKKMMVKENE